MPLFLVKHSFMFKVAVALAVGAAFGSSPVVAQRGVVRGGVVSAESGDRIAYAVVVLLPHVPQQFTGEDGTFLFAGVAPGTYRLVARQVGYQPLDTTIVVAETAVNLQIALQRVTVRLAALQVTRLRSNRGEWNCQSPGPPDAEREPEFAALFGQLRENAARALLLADDYPYHYHVSRRIWQESDDGHSTVALNDTMEIASGDRWHYRPGRVVDDWVTGGGRRSSTRLVHLPELPDLADSTFAAHHCYRYGGIDTVDAQPLVRIDFRADAHLPEADIDGSAWLMPDSFQLRQLRVQLTNARVAVPGVIDMSATVTYREVLRSVMVIDRLLAITRWDLKRSVEAQKEEQRLISFDFERAPGAH